MQAGLHGQLTCAGQSMAWRVVTSGYGKTDLVVELGRRGDVAFLLNMESHAVGTGLNASTLRSGGVGDNSSEPFAGRWADLTLLY